jgi:hypothetical protein
MENTLKNIIERFQNDSTLKIRNQEFFNEILFEGLKKTLSKGSNCEFRLSPCSGIQGAFKDLKAPSEVLFDFISFTIF